MIKKIIQDHIQHLENLAKEKGVSRRQWLNNAKVSESTFYRWQNGATVPNTRTISRLEEMVVDQK